MPISFSMIVLGSQMVVAVADGVPNFDVARSCKLDVAATTGLSVDQSIKSCVNDEQKAKRQLASQWSKFPAPSRASCISQESIGGTPSYVSLLTCLQMGQWRAIIALNAVFRSGSWRCAAKTCVSRGDQTRSVRSGPRGQNRRAIL